MPATYSSLSALVLEIKQLCSQNAVGTLFISTAENKSAQIVLEKGQIVAAFYSRDQGEDAIKKLVESQGIRCRFQSGKVPRRIAMPSTNAVLSFLEEYAAKGAAAPVQETKESVSEQSLSSEEKKLLIELLAISIGPMAEIIAVDHLSVVTNVSDAIERLANEIPSAEQAQVFRNDAVARLQEMGTASTAAENVGKSNKITNILGSGLGAAVTAVGLRA